MTSLLMRAQSGDYKRNIILCRELCQGWLDCQGEIVDQDWHSLLQKVGFMSSPPPCCVDQNSVEKHHCRSGDVWTLLACFSDDMVNFAFASSSSTHHHRQLIIISNPKSTKIITQYVVLKSNWMLRSEKWGNGICWSWPRSLGSTAVTQNNHICPLMGIELPSTDQKRITRHRMAVRSQSSLPQLNELAEYIGDEI